MLILRIFLALIPSTHAKCPSVQWLIDNCLSNSTSLASDCFTPKNSNINCVGIKNSEYCYRAVSSFSDSSRAQLLTFDKTSFAYDLERNRLCFHPKIRSTDDIANFFGLHLDIDFFHEGNPHKRTQVTLGAIYPSGVTNAKQLHSSVACAPKPTHIPYSNASFFVSVGFSMPPQLGANKTKQSQEYSLGSLAHISLDNRAFVKDYFDQSKANMSFPKESCKTEKEENDENWFQKDCKEILLVVLIILFGCCCISCIRCALLALCSKDFIRREFFQPQGVAYGDQPCVSTQDLVGESTAGNRVQPPLKVISPPSVAVHGDLLSHGPSSNLARTSSV